GGGGTALLGLLPDIDYRPGQSLTAPEQYRDEGADIRANLRGRFQRREDGRGRDLGGGSPTAQEAAAAAPDFLAVPDRARRYAAARAGPAALGWHDPGVGKRPLGLRLPVRPAGGAVPRRHDLGRAVRVPPRVGGRRLRVRPGVRPPGGGAASAQAHLAGVRPGGPDVVRLVPLSPDLSDVLRHAGRGQPAPADTWDGRAPV